jgi:hypothetical protein
VVGVLLWQQRLALAVARACRRHWRRARAGARSCGRGKRWQRSARRRACCCLVCSRAEVVGRHLALTAARDHVAFGARHLLHQSARPVLGGLQLQPLDPVLRRLVRAPPLRELGVLLKQRGDGAATRHAHAHDHHRRRRIGRRVGDSRRRRRPCEGGRLQLLLLRRQRGWQDLLCGFAGRRRWGMDIQQMRCASGRVHGRQWRAAAVDVLPGGRRARRRRSRGGGRGHG